MRFLRTYLTAAGLILTGLVLLGVYFFMPVNQSKRLPDDILIQIWDRQKLLEAKAHPAIPANLLGVAGLRLYPGDRILADGIEIRPDRAIKSGQVHLLQYIPGNVVTLTDGGRVRSFSSGAATLGEALWQAGIRLNLADQLQPDAATSLNGPLQAEIRRAVPLSVQLGGQTIQGYSASASVGAALAEMGLSLQGLDFAIPPESAPLPADGSIRVVRVTEQVSLEQKTIPFKSQYQVDPETELDQKSVLQAGETGLIVSRVRVRLEDGQEISRTKEAEWTARLPKDQLVGYGTKPVVHTETVDGVTIEYWRKLTAYATSYAPCEIYPGRCSYNTASGMTLTKGVAAVIRSWYNQMRGQQVYVPGYGTATIADIGGGVAGQNWIDLGYSDSDYVEWHQPVTIYFLTPIPAYVPVNLP